VKEDLVHSQSDFVYHCFADLSVNKAGWYVAVRQEENPWKVKWGPFKEESHARKARTEVHRDIGNPQKLQYRIARLTKASPDVS